MLAVALPGLGAAPARLGDDLGATLQRGLFEEEANHDFAAAIKAYEAVVNATDTQRKLAGTALFRLAECHRKLGRTNEAVTLHQRVLREYPDQPRLAELSRDYLAAAGAASGLSTSERARYLEPELVQAQARATQLRTLYQQLTNLSRLELRKSIPTAAPDDFMSQLLKDQSAAEQRFVVLTNTMGLNSPEVRAARASLDAMGRQIEDRLDGILAGLRIRVSSEEERVADLKQQLNDLRRASDPDGASALTQSGRAEQRRLFEEEIKIVEKELSRLNTLAKDRLGDPSALANKQRDLLSLRRQLAALGDAPAGAATAPDEAGRSPARLSPEAAEDAEIRSVQSLLKDSPDLVNARNQFGSVSSAKPSLPMDGLTLLHKAAMEGKFKLSEFLLANGADPNAASGSNPSQPGPTPLAVAARAGNRSMVELLLSKGANVHGNTALTPLHEAASQGFKSVVEVLLDAKADVNAQTGTKRTPLHEAAARGFPGVALTLISRGADVNTLHHQWTQGIQIHNVGRLFNLDGSALHLAVERGDRAMVELLLTNKANPNLRNHSGLLPLHVAVYRGLRPVAEALLKGGAEINAHAFDATDFGNNQRRWTPLNMAIVAARLDMVQFLLDHGAEPDRPHDPFNSSKGGWTPLHQVLGDRPKDFLGMAELLLQHKANPNLTNDYGITPIFSALRESDTAQLELLLKNGADPNARNAEGRTALNQPYLSHDIYKTLLAGKADPNTQDKAGAAPLHRLADVARQIPSAPPPPGSPTSDGVDLNSPAALAELLLNAGANPNLRNNSGYTPLNMFGTPANSSVPVGQAFIAVLRKHGARDEMLEPISDLHSIRVWRKGHSTPRVVFARDADGRNRFTLLETIYNFYKLSAWPPARVEPPAVEPVTGLRAPRTSRLIGNSSPFKPGDYMPFPDFTRVRVHRLVDPAKNEKRVTEINLLNARGEFDCDKDQLLEFGDLVELPEREFRLDESKIGLTDTQEKVLRACLPVRVKFVVKGEPTEISLLPYFYQSRLSFVMQMSNVRAVLRSSSDLTHLTLRRTDPVTKAPLQFTINATEPALVRVLPEDDLVLRDGDVIEVPDK